MAQVSQQKCHGDLVANVTSQTLPPGIEKSGDLRLVQLIERNLPLLKPSAQLDYQPDLEPAVHVAIALLRNRICKTLQMWPDGADLKTLWVFSLGIKTSIH